jgi:hypothetical protein
LEAFEMFDLQAQLDKRLAELKRHSGKASRGLKVPDAFSAAQIKATLKKSGVLDKSGKVRTLITA